MKQTIMNRALDSAKQNSRLILSMLAALALSACVSVPQQIQFPNQAQGSDLLLRQAIQKPDAYQGQQVRWGGLIAKVENAEQNTRVEIVGQLLDSRGRPRLSEQSEGRFVAIISGFIDPLIYKEGRELTVIGTTTAPVTDKIGEHNYTFPVVQSQGYYLWEKRPEYRYVSVPYYSHWSFGYGRHWNWPYYHYYGGFYRHRYGWPSRFYGSRYYGHPRYYGGGRHYDSGRRDHGSDRDGGRRSPPSARQPSARQPHARAPENLENGGSRSRRER